MLWAELAQKVLISINMPCGCEFPGDFLNAYNERIIMAAKRFKLSKELVPSDRNPEPNTREGQ